MIPKNDLYSVYLQGFIGIDLKHEYESSEERVTAMTAYSLGVRDRNDDVLCLKGIDEVISHTLVLCNLTDDESVEFYELDGDEILMYLSASDFDDDGEPIYEKNVKRKKIIDAVTETVPKEDKAKRNYELTKKMVDSPLGLHTAFHMYTQSNWELFLKSNEELKESKEEFDKVVEKVEKDQYELFAEDNARSVLKFFFKWWFTYGSLVVKKHHIADMARSCDVNWSESFGLPYFVMTSEFVMNSLKKKIVIGRRYVDDALGYRLMITDLKEEKEGSEQ